MSLILEALRKSEAERRRGEAPDLLRTDTGPVAAATSPLHRVWWALPLLLGVAVLAWWARGELATAASGAPPATEAPPPASAPPRAAEPPVLPEIERLQATVAVPAPTPAPAPALAPEASAAQAPVAAPAGPVALGTLPPAQRTALPPLRLSMHLWNEDPSRRVAILDGRRVTPGDRLGDAVVADIRPDGVLLDWQGRQVLVPLP